MTYEDYFKSKTEYAANEIIHCLEVKRTHAFGGWELVDMFVKKVFNELKPRELIEVYRILKEKYEPEFPEVFATETTP